MANEISYTDSLTPAILQGLIRGNGQNTTTTTSGGTVDPAAMAQLQSVLAGLSGGAPVTTGGVPQVSPNITAEQLAAIFSQGAQQIPNLTAAFANAAGARSSNNSGLQLALTDLNEGLTRQAALLGQEQQKLSTDAAYRNSSLGLQAADINARMAAAMAAARAQMATQMAQMQRTPQVQQQTTRQDGGVDPEKLMLGGFLLNQANKGDWLGRIFGNKGSDASYENPNDASMIQLPSADYAMPGMDAGIAVDWQLPALDQNYLTADFGNWNIPSGSSFDFGTDFGSSLGEPSYDFSGFDFDNWGSSLDFSSDFNYDFGSSGSDFEFGDYSNEFWFADGGSPERAMRNRANMGAPGVRQVTGVGNRDASKSPGLIAPVRFPTMPAFKMPTMPAPMPMTSTQAPARPLMAPQRTPFENDRDGSGNSSMEAPTNQAFSPAVASGVKDVAGMLQSLGPLGQLLGLPSMGMAPSLATASDPNKVARQFAVSALGVANPILGLLAQALIPQPKPPKPAAATSGNKPSKTPSYDAANVTDAQVVNIPQVTAVQPGGSMEGANVVGNNVMTGYGVVGNRGRGDGPGYGGGIGQSGGNAAGVGSHQAKDGGSFARQGLIQGPGTGTSDSIEMPMADVSNGEYIVSADVVDALGIELFDALQAAFHKGGPPN